MRRSSFVPALLALALSACTDSTSPDELPTTGRALLLVSFGQPGVSVVGDTGSSAVHLELGDAYDGAVFTVRGDSVLTTSSKAGGDKLYVLELAAGVPREIALPAGSNPAGATFLPGEAAWQGASYAVALRDSGAVALVDLAGPGGAPDIGMVRQMGACPSDVLVAFSALWSVDANQNCRDAYQSLGPVRLIRATLGSATRDTVTLPDSVRGAARAFIVGDEAFVVATGDYAGRQGRIVAVNLATRQVRGTLRLPAGMYATATRLGGDGALYVTAARAWPEAYEPRVFRVDPATLAFSGTRAAGAEYLDLREDGALVRCDAATADAEGLLWCASNGAVASRLLVFGAQAAITREVAIPGGLVADMVVR
jgi:hypothetical protein